MSIEARAALRSAIATLQSALDALGGGIDWSKPLEMLDGTPVKLDGVRPDRDGDYWFRREDGKRVPSVDPSNTNGYTVMCVHPNGCEEGTSHVIVRNRG